MSNKVQLEPGMNQQKADTLLNPEVWRRLTMFPGNPACPLSPGGPCVQEKQKKVDRISVKSFENVI